jgi:large subunit ribosomal protein L10
MEKPRAEKVALVEDARARLSSADAALLTEYRGLKVDEMAILRRALRPAGGEYKVYKNTLVRFAARDLGLDALEPLLEGPVAIAFVRGDAAVAARALRDFARTHPQLLVKGGLLGDDLLSAEQAGALADLPSREVLLSQLAGMLAAPLRQMAGGMQALVQDLAFGLRALLDQRSAEQSPSAEAPSAEASSEASSTEGPSAEEAAPEGPSAEAPTADETAPEEATPGPAAEDPAEAGPPGDGVPGESSGTESN